MAWGFRPACKRYQSAPNSSWCNSAQASTNRCWRLGKEPETNSCPRQAGLQVREGFVVVRSGGDPQPVEQTFYTVFDFCLGGRPIGGLDDIERPFD